MYPDLSTTTVGTNADLVPSTSKIIYWEVQEKEPGVKVSPEDSLANLV